MHPLIALLHLHWVASRRAVAWTLPFLAIPAVALLSRPTSEPLGLCLLALASSAALGLPVILAALGPGTEAFVLGLPASRNQVVLARLLSGLLALAAGLVLPLGVAVLMMVFHPGQPVPLREALAPLALGYLLEAALLCVSLPLTHRFGASRGLLAYSLLLVSALILGAIWMGPTDLLEATARHGAALMDSPTGLGLAALTVLLLALGALRLSQRAYQGRGF